MMSKIQCDPEISLTRFLNWLTGTFTSKFAKMIIVRYFVSVATSCETLMSAFEETLTV